MYGETRLASGVRLSRLTSPPLDERANARRLVVGHVRKVGLVRDDGRRRTGARGKGCGVCPQFSADVDANNIGLAYRPGEGYDVYWNVAGEWIGYTFSVAEPGLYTFIP